MPHDVFTCWGVWVYLLSRDRRPWHGTIFVGDERKPDDAPNADVVL